jgi:hypothetical protein
MPGTSAGCYFPDIPSTLHFTPYLMTEQQQPDTVFEIPSCPRCQGPMWDNREGKRNPKAPDFKCKDRECDGVVWPPRAAASTTSAATPSAPRAASTAGASAASSVTSSVEPQPPADGMPACPICGGAMWDDRLGKRNPRAPDFKCKNKPRERGGPGCEGVIWPARDGSPSPYQAPTARRSAPPSAPSRFDAPLDSPPPYDAPPHDDDDLPF